MNPAQQPACPHKNRRAPQRPGGERWPSGKPTFARTLSRVAVLILAWYALVFNTLLIAAAFAAPSSVHWELCLAASNTGSAEDAPTQPGPAQIPACVKHCLNSTASDGAPVLELLAPVTATSHAVIFPHPLITWTDAAWSGTFARGPPEAV